MGERHSPNTLFDAIKRGHLRQVKLLLEAGTDPDMVNMRTLETPLMYAVLLVNEKETRLRMLGLLLGYGADVNAQNHHHQTALMLAVILYRPEIVELLVKQPSLRINLQDDVGNTALMYAALHGFLDIIQLLLQQRHHQLDLNLKNNRDQTALMLAAENDHQDLIALLSSENNHQLVMPSQINNSNREMTRKKGKSRKLKSKEVLILGPGPPLPRITVTHSTSVDAELPSSSTRLMQRSSPGLLSPPLNLPKSMGARKYEEVKLPPIRDAIPANLPNQRSHGQLMRPSFSPEYMMIRDDMLEMESD